MPRQNAVTRLEAVAVGLGLLADELQEIYGEPTPNLLYWRNEILEAIEDLTGATNVGERGEGQRRSAR